MNANKRLAYLVLSTMGALMAGPADGAFVISEATGLFTPSFRGSSSTTHFGWRYGTWDGNPSSDGQPDITPDVINGTPSDNPANLAGPLLTQSGAVDIVSSSDNIYSSVSSVNSAGLILTIPTDGLVGTTGYTTIIIQGMGMGGYGMPLDTFGFGNINGIEPVFVYGLNNAAEPAGQWFAKWEIPGNQESYTVSIHGHSAGVGVLSVTDMMVDTWFSETSFASDLAVVPEPTTLALCVAGAALLFRHRR